MEHGPARTRCPVSSWGGGRGQQLNKQPPEADGIPCERLALHPVYPRISVVTIVSYSSMPETESRAFTVGCRLWLCGWMLRLGSHLPSSCLSLAESWTHTPGFPELLLPRVLHVGKIHLLVCVLWILHLQRRVLCVQNTSRCGSMLVAAILDGLAQAQSIAAPRQTRTETAEQSGLFPSGTS